MGVVCKIDGHYTNFEVRSQATDKLLMIIHVPTKWMYVNIEIKHIQTLFAIDYDVSKREALHELELYIKSLDVVDPRQHFLARLMLLVLNEKMLNALVSVDVEFSVKLVEVVKNFEKSLGPVKESVSMDECT